MNSFINIAGSVIRGTSWLFRPKTLIYEHSGEAASDDQNILILTCFLFTPSLHLVRVHDKTSWFRFLLSK